MIESGKKDDNRQHLTEPESAGLPFLKKFGKISSEQLRGDGDTDQSSQVQIPCFNMALNNDN
jgi:hypothetical protein